MSSQDVISLTQINHAGKASERLVPISEITHALVGLYVEKIAIPYGRRFYRYNAILVVGYEDQYVFKRLNNVHVFRKWTLRFEGNIPLYYTDLDVSKAYQAHFYTPVDFSQIHSVSHDVVRPLIGLETYQSGLDVWEPEGMMEAVEASRRNQTIPRTRRAETRTMCILFIYNFFFAWFILLQAPIHPNGIVELTDLILIGYVMTNLLIPVCLVFWRRFSNRYAPFLFAAVTLASNTLGNLIGFWIHDLPMILTSILILNIFNIVLWTVAMISMKMVKLIVKFMKGWEFVR